MLDPKLEHGILYRIVRASLQARNRRKMTGSFSREHGKP